MAQEKQNGNYLPAGKGTPAQPGLWCWERTSPRPSGEITLLLLLTSKERCINVDKRLPWGCKSCYTLHDFRADLGTKTCHSPLNQRLIATVHPRIVTVRVHLLLAFFILLLQTMTSICGQQTSKFLDYF